MIHCRYTRLSKFPVLFSDLKQLKHMVLPDTCQTLITNHKRLNHCIFNWRHFVCFSNWDCLLNINVKTALACVVCIYLQNNDVCECRHNTEGDNCDRCEPLYNSEPWRIATDIDPAHCIRGLSLYLLISMWNYHSRLIWGGMPLFCDLYFWCDSIKLVL